MKYIRKRNVIRTTDGKVVKAHKSINAAKKHSRELQATEGRGCVSVDKQ